MNTTLFYFSATGNSLTVARQIAATLGNTQIIRMDPDNGHAPTANTENIGLVFPVIMFGLPLIVRRFIQRLQAPADAYIFAIATCGGMPCSTLKEAESLFSERGMKLAAGFSVSMVNNCTTIAQAPPENKQIAKLTKARLAVERICESVKKQVRYIDGGNPVLNWYFSGVLHKKAIGFIPTAAQYFFADEKCSGCGMCAIVCPMHNIALDEKKPQWQERCEQCYACLQWCPKEAIQVKGKKTACRRRYRHPAVHLADIAANSNDDNNAGTNDRIRIQPAYQHAIRQPIGAMHDMDLYSNV